MTFGMTRPPRHRFIKTFFTAALAASTVVAIEVANPLPAAAVSTSLVISEFRLRGPSGANDEFIELQNIGAASITVADSGAGTGFAIAASDGTARCVIPNGVVIPRFGHYLCVNSTSYSLGSYPAGNATTATGDATYTTDILDNAGIALFDTSVSANFDLARRIDAVGAVAEANALYKEGVGYPTLTPFSIDYSFYRNLSTGSVNTMALTTATPAVSEDTDDNATDFVFVDTNGTSAGAGQRLGTPGPENLSSPVPNGGLAVSLLDECVDANTAPNAAYDATSVPASNSTFGTVEFRRTVTNNTGANVTRLRFRIADQRSFPSPSGIADMRGRTSTDVAATVDRAPCGSGTASVTVRGTTLETPPSQPNGSSFNSSLSTELVTLATPLASGASIDVRLMFGLQQTGAGSVRIIAEAVTSGTTTAPVLTCLGMTSTTIITNFCGGASPTAAPETYSMPEDATLAVTAPGVLDNDTDDSGPLTATLVDGPSHGSVTLNPDGSFIYEPTPDYHGSDSFTYTANDGFTNSNITTVTVNISQTYDAPVGVADSFPATEDVTLVVPAPGVLANETNIDGYPLSAALATGPTHGVLALQPDGSFTYTPAQHFNGTDSFTYTLAAELATRVEASASTAEIVPAATTVTINVAAVNDAPMSVGESNETIMDAALESPVPGPLANDTDADGDPLTAVLITAPTHGILVLAADGSYRYTPDTGYVGPDSFTYAASDGSVLGNTVTVVLNVAARATLPATGTDSRLLVMAALGSTVVGAVLLLGSRRRRSVA